MIVGDQPIVTRRGIHISSKSLETIGIHRGTQVHIMPFHTFEHRPKEPGTEFPTDLLVTPIPPQLWPFVIRFSLRIRNRPGTLNRALEFFTENKINILLLEATRSGHHHAALNIHGQVQAIENTKLPEIRAVLKRLRKESEPRLVKYYRELFQPIAQPDSKDWKTLCEAIGLNEKENHLDPPWWWRALDEEAAFPIKRDCPALNAYQSSLKGGPPNWTNRSVQILRATCGKPRDSCCGCGSTESESCKSHFDALLIDVALRYLKRYDSVPLRSALETEVERARGEVRRIRDAYGTDIRADEEAKRQAEDQITPLKIMLDMIITFKRILSEHFKIQIVAKALDEIIQQNSAQIEQPARYPNSLFLYNILFYWYNLKFPYFARDISFISAILSETSETFEMAKMVARISRALHKLAKNRPRLGGMETRLDLDPVVITPLEKLCHAYHHRAYDKEVACSAEESLIPFPKPPEPQPAFIVNSLPHESSATVAVAARNTEDLTLRLCLLPVGSLRRFVGIRLKDYWRECDSDCGPTQLTALSLLTRAKTDSTTDPNTEFTTDPTTDPGADPTVDPTIDPTIDSIADPNADSKTDSNIDLRADATSAEDRSCTGSSCGLMHALARAVFNFEQASAIGRNTLNLWRVYNNTFEMSDLRESGSIYFLANAFGREFYRFTEDFPTLLKERLSQELCKKRSRRHITIGDISTSRISGGRVFVSLSFSHPMWREWLGCIQRIGKQMGFSEVAPVLTRTGPVTPEVSQQIRDSHAMIQILATPLPQAGRPDLGSQSLDQTWLHSEYLAAVSMGLYVVRLVEECSQNTESLRIGRDHPAFLFSLNNPFSEFEKVVEEAFQELASKLADKLGFHEIELGRRGPE